MKLPSGLPRLPNRPADAHKGTFGTVVVIGGSPTMLGAPCAVASAALRVGAGLVRFAVPPAILPQCLVCEPSAIGMDLPRQRARLVAQLPADAVLAIGPGLGTGAAYAPLITALWAGEHRLVVDADALTLLARLQRTSGPRSAPTVLTPHPRECQRLCLAAQLRVDPLATTQRSQAARLVAHRFGGVLVLKGQGTVVSDGRRTFINPTGDAALSIPGSGDVLTGMVAGFLAQGMPVLAAARLAVFIHGAAGDLWSRQHGPVGMLARDLIGLLPLAMDSVRRAQRSSAGSR